MIQNKFFTYIAFILIISFLLSKETILVSFYDYETKEKIKKNITYQLKNSKGKILKKGKLKKSRKKHKIKYEFDNDEENINYGKYSIVFEWLDKNKIKRQNVLDIRKAWYYKRDFLEGSISGSEQNITRNKDNGIKVFNNGQHPYHFNIPLKKKNSVLIAQKVGLVLPTSIG